MKNKFVMLNTESYGWAPGAVDHFADSDGPEFKSVEVYIDEATEIAHAKAHPWYHQYCWICKYLQSKS